MVDIFSPFLSHRSFQVAFTFHLECFGRVSLTAVQRIVLVEHSIWQGF